MKVSYFETGRYVPPPDLPREWPVPPAAYDPAVGAEAFRGMVERVQFVERLGFDWISVSEHHYSPRILTPSPVVSAAWLAARVPTIKIALLGPIVPTANPIRIAEEMAMLDTLAPGRIVVGLLRGTTNEYLSYDLNPSEARERTDEGMELILKAWGSRSRSAGRAGISNTARFRSGRARSNLRRRSMSWAPAPKPEPSLRATIAALAFPTATSNRWARRRRTTVSNVRNTAGRRDRTTSSIAPT